MTEGIDEIRRRIRQIEMEIVDLERNRSLIAADEYEREKQRFRADLRQLTSRAETLAREEEKT